MTISPAFHISNRSILWRQFKQIIYPYWVSQEKVGAIALLLLLLGLTVVGSGVVILETFPIREIISALAAQDYSRLMQGVGFFIAIAAVGIPVYALKNYVQAKLGLYWRQWLTHSFLEKYFSEQTFYSIHKQSTIDNPDQRIAEDIRNVTQQSLYFLVAVLDVVLQFVGFIGVLWTISRFLTGVLLLYILISTVSTTSIFGRILTLINFEQLKQEANFRYSLVRVRENAEAIAFYQGQIREFKQSRHWFKGVFRNFARLIRWQFYLNLFQSSYQYLTLLLPILILAPRIITGELELGAVTQAQVAFERMGFTLGLVIHQFAQLSALAAGTDRLAILDKQTNTVTPVEDQDNLPKKSYLDFVETPYLALHQVTLQIPNSQTALVCNLSMTVIPGQSLLIIGASGVGKSSLFRAIAGLWRSGTGCISHPPQQDMLFLPQRPYMTLGTLREQLLYPHQGRTILDAQLFDILDQVNLSDLAMRFGGFDTQEDWSQVLSNGEQQRLAFARLLLIQPAYAFLDEATSALDPANEEKIYQHLSTTPITYISIGHRPTLLNYHDRILELSANQQWRLISVSEYMETLAGNLTQLL